MTALLDVAECPPELLSRCDDDALERVYDAISRAVVVGGPQSAYALVSYSELAGWLPLLEWAAAEAGGWVEVVSQKPVWVPRTGELDYQLDIQSDLSRSSIERLVEATLRAFSS